MKYRSLIAVSPSHGILHAAQKLIKQLRPVAGDVRWTKPENLHFTLQFLGDVDVLEIPALSAAVNEAAREVEAFEMEVRGTGAFPAIDRPRTLWLGAAEGAESMVALQTAIQDRLHHLGFRGESRRYIPHLTLGRVTRSASPRALSQELSKLADFEAGKMLVDEVTVYSSQLSAEGPTYDVLAHAPLAE
jgi:RNA 2',3'-cyclic 3'-phosphodiesterase